MTRTETAFFRTSSGWELNTAATCGLSALIGSPSAAGSGVLPIGFSTAARRILFRRVIAEAGGTLAMSAVSGAEAWGAASGAASVTGAMLGAGGTSKAGRLFLLRRSVGIGWVGSGSAGIGWVGSVGTCTVGITVVETGSVEAVPRVGASVSGLVGVTGLVTGGAASARCRPAFKGRD